MALAKTRAEFATRIKTKLGAPVLEINAADVQIDDRIDDALLFWYDYNCEGTIKQYYKHIITAFDFPDRVKEVLIHDGGTGYSNTDTLVFTGTGTGTGADGTITTNGNGVITALNLTAGGHNYSQAPTLAVTTSGGTGANLEVLLGGYITMPDNIIGSVGIFDLTNAITNISNMFSIQYQIALNEIWSLSSYSMVPYYTTIMHLNLIQQLLVGAQPVRFSKYEHRFYLDMAWERVAVGNYIIVEAYKIIDPEVYPDVWTDQWLFKYATALCKQQLGTNLKKFGNMVLPGGIIFNGQATYDEGTKEVEDLEDKMINQLSCPPAMLIG